MGKTLTEKYQGQVPLDTKYHIANIFHKESESFDLSSCDNCGHVISNVFVIEGDNKKSYNVGSECVIPLTNNSLELKEWKRKLAQEKKFIKFHLKECKCGLRSKTHGTAFSYRVDVEKWEHCWVYRFQWEKWEKFITKNNF